jgi:tetratricopeptide (TPR) repeat protein
VTIAFRRTAPVLAAGVLAVVLLLVGAVLGTPGGTADGEEVVSRSAPTGQAGSLEALQARLERVPGDHPGWAALGLLYVDRARVTADPSWYAKAQAALGRSLEVSPEQNGPALTGLATLHAAQHDFARAADTASQALAINSYDATAYGVLADALTELGRYDEAADALQQMADVNPDFAALARISYARELRGDVDGAREAMEQALGAAGSAEDAGFALHHLGELAWNYGGNVQAASTLYERGLARDPSSLPLQASAARAAAAAGRPDEAVAAYADVTARVPVQQYLVEEGELLASLGRTSEAQDRFELVRTATMLLEDSGAVVDLETALFEADHGSPEQALVAAQAAYGRAPSIFAADALAWALHVNGRHDEALARADEALALGGRPALFLFHRGMIAAALGRTDEAVRDLRSALEVNPHFSVPHAETARTTLTRLGG